MQHSNRTKVAKSQKKTVKTNSICQQSEDDSIILRAKTCHKSEKDGTILKPSQNMSTVRKRWYNTQTEPKPVTSQKKMEQYSNSAKNRSPVRKRWYNTQTEQKPVNSQKKMVQYSNRAKLANSQNKMVQYSKSAKT